MVGVQFPLPYGRVRQPRLSNHPNGKAPVGSRFGLEGLVSKCRDRPSRAGRSPNWTKVKNPAMNAVVVGSFCRDAEQVLLASLRLRFGRLALWPRTGDR
jgi:hypothetical protein